MTAQLDFWTDSKEGWLRLARATARKIAREKGEVCADDIHKLCPIPRWLDRRIMGSVFDGMTYLRHQKSRRAECHHRAIGVFTVEKRAA